MIAAAERPERAAQARKKRTRKPLPRHLYDTEMPVWYRRVSLQSKDSDMDSERFSSATYGDWSSNLSTGLASLGDSLRIGMKRLLAYKLCLLVKRLVTV